MLLWRRLWNATVFAITMAYIESAIVVYLRRLYYSGRGGFRFPLVIIDTPTMLLELGRETCTVVMLVTFSIAAGRTKVSRGALFLFLFGVWDIFYYVWLKVFLGWPPSLLTWDVLFLIPVPWIGPVLAPMLVAATMILMALVMLWLEQRGPMRSAGRDVWFLEIVAALTIIASFTIDVISRLDIEGRQLAQWVPTYYRWWMFAIGLALGLIAFTYWAWCAWRARW
jgi:hypothetical protein